MSSSGGPTGVRRFGVAGLSAALLTTGLLLTWLSEPSWASSTLPFTLPWWSLIPGYAIVYRLRLDYEYRTETRTLYLTQLPLVIGLVFVNPWWHLAARLTAVLASLTHTRQRPSKLAFNLGLTTCETAAAIAMFAVLVGRPQAGHTLWLGILVAVLVSELLSQLVMELLLSVLGAQQTWASRGASLASCMSMAAIFGSASVIFVAAAWTEPLTLAAMVILATALVIAYRRHRELAVRHLQASEAQQFVKGLGPLSLDDPTSAVVLDHMRELLHAQVLELSLRADDAWSRVTFRNGGPAMKDTPPAEDVLVADRLGSSGLDSGDRMHTPLIGAAGLFGVLTARERFGDALKFGPHDLRLLDTLGAELTASLERGQLQRDLATAATTDPLTMLPNLSDLSTRLNRMLLELPQGLIVATVAVDSFREVNDTLGHEVGDELLQEVARRLRFTFPNALIGRIGGGRFAVCVSSDEYDGDASLFGLAIRAQIEGGAQLGPVGTHIKLSVGCVQAPEHGTESATLIRRAETAMYSARHAQGGPILWEPVYEVQGHRRLAVVMALREAVANGAIGVAYQPKIRTTDNSVAGVEALARWTHPALGAISPAEFIPLAEAAGLMGPLTTLVLRQALTTCKGWQRRGGRVGVAVNVSAETLLNPMFVTEVAALLTAANVSPDLLTLELTEGVVVEDPVRAAERMAELSQLGVKLSVDDFGTGYSSLTYLKGLPVDEVKIDKGFVDRVTDDAADRAVVRAVVDIAHTMGLTVVAEGVEHTEQLRALAELGVDEAQGYLLARPMAALNMAQWLRRRDNTDTTAAGKRAEAFRPPVQRA